MSKRTDIVCDFCGRTLTLNGFFNFVKADGAVKIRAKQLGKIVDYEMKGAFAKWYPRTYHICPMCIKTAKELCGKNVL